MGCRTDFRRLSVAIGDGAVEKKDPGGSAHAFARY